MSIERVSSAIVYTNPWMQVREDQVRRADGSDGIFGVVDKPTGVIVVPRDANDRLYLVEQYRYPVQARRWEFPAGTAPDRVEMPPDQLAARELAEETGYRAASLTRLGMIDVAPGFASQRGVVFLATDLTAGDSRPEHEEQDMHGRWWTPTDFTDAVREGQICDAQTLAAYALTLVTAAR